jgi:hypothetical protein
VILANGAEVVKSFDAKVATNENMSDMTMEAED